MCTCVCVYTFPTSVHLESCERKLQPEDYPDCGFLNTICHVREQGFLGRVPDLLYENTANCK